MKLQIKKMSMVLVLLTILGTGKASAQFASSTYNLNNGLSCTITVFMEFTSCPTPGGVYYSSSTYTVLPFSVVTIPVVAGDDAWVIVSVPGATPSPLSPVSAAGASCVGAPTSTSGTNGCGIIANNFNVWTTSTDLHVQ
jgi:hypothetical protein